MHKAVKQIVRYKAWANEITFSALSRVAEDELYKEYKTKFKSIANTLNHVYVVDNIFKSHLSKTVHGYTSRNTRQCPAFDALWSKQKIMDQWYIDFSQTISAKTLEDSIVFEFVDGGQGEMTISEILFHVANHGTYHRGFVSMMMSQIPAMMPANDLPVYLRDTRKTRT